MSSYVVKRGEVIPFETRQLIAKRYRTVTKAVNREFWNINDEYSNSFYVGSYGRGTAIDSSDIDIFVSLPKTEYDKYTYTSYNGQSRLLQAVRAALLEVYPRSQIKADGQVVKIDFSDGMKFEILPAFKQEQYGYGWGYGSTTPTYQYPDTNMGGNWKPTAPKVEQEAMSAKNKSSNGLLLDTCKHIRYIRDNCFSSYHLSGIVIDSFVYSVMGGWGWTETTNPYSLYKRGDYENTLYNYVKQYEYWHNFNLRAPGSNQEVDVKGSYDCLLKVLSYMVK